MKIEVDTNKDSESTIRKAIKILESFLEQAPSEAPQPAAGAFNMFGAPEEKQEEPDKPKVELY